MKRAWILAAFVVVCLIQLAAPASMIWRQERAFAHGRAFKFMTAPVDPYDAFRGKYVALSFRDIAPQLPKDFPSGYTGKAYAPIIVGEDGFARFGEAALSAPKDAPYLTLNVEGGYPGNVLPLPFDRYFMEEEKAPAAERAYAEHTREKDAYVVVRILDGDWAIEDLIVGGKPIGEALKKETR
ncbi:GDYXXLXY domain-containing protein [Methylocystis parvus]|uniref:GDYXXLXY domain-containing protein n=1 Tax=Methylocystis parvus TaxID=134 RepID=A0A6B8M4X7_9HYPH|nr:GDYXXLXY domain-containing protein [Methylocystis parvus]QGM99014.1 GDYXXLXY domain-containing protein [Methylocystis parvus]WBK00621.1 GDYXXLXY domain-containing protein [Methylocystis parvus OBBP]